MKALTVRQPYASLIVAGMKTVETRSWATTHRGKIAIHAGQVVDDDVELAVCGFTAMQLIPMPVGCVIATARLVDIVPILEGDDDDHTGARIVSWRDPVQVQYRDRDVRWTLDAQSRFGDFTPGRYGWLLADVVPIDPVPAVGALSLWDWND